MNFNEEHEEWEIEFDKMLKRKYPQLNKCDAMTEHLDEIGMYSKKDMAEYRKTMEWCKRMDEMERGDAYYGKM